MKEIKNVSIIGMGALGVMYGSHLAHHMGFDHVTYLMDEKRYEKYKGSTVTCNGEELSFTCVPASQAVPADLVIVAVKSTGLTEALDTMKNCIGPDTVILSVMNLIDRFGIDGYWVGHTKAWVIPGTEDLMPYISKTDKYRKWLAGTVGMAVISIILAGIGMLL